MRQDNQVSRRALLKTTGVAAAGMTSVSARSYARILGTNERLNLAIVGCGHIVNASHLKALLPMQENGELGILGICDVYKSRAQECIESIREVGGNAKLFRDYRDILAMADVDYLLIATPEHWHARQTLDALD
ncbi:MAG: Gfo/Idh/MocA family oxidoreductase, partial [Planctomycetota bacterium]